MRITILNFVRKIIIYDTQCSVFVTEVQIRRRVKLIQRFLKLPKDFTFDETITLLGYLGYRIHNKGKSSFEPRTYEALIFERESRRSPLIRPLF